MRMYVGNLSYQATESELRALFAQYGEVVSARIITDRDTGQSRGFGFVELADDEASNNAISELNGSDFGGRRLVCNEARPREPRGGGYAGGSNRW